MRVERAAQGAEIGAHGADQLGARDDGPAHDVAGARGVLGEAVNEHVHVVVAVLVKPGEGVVHDGERARRPGEARERADVGDLGDRVGRALEEHQARGLRRECAFHAREILDGKHAVRHAEAAQQAADEIAARVVGLDEADDVVTLLGEREQRVGYRRDAGGGDQTFLTPLQLRQQLLQLARGGIGGARVEEARALATQVAFGVLERIELEFDGLVDRRHQRTVAGRQLDRGWMIDESGLFHDPGARRSGPSQARGEGVEPRGRLIERSVPLGNAQPHERQRLRAGIER